MRVIGITRGLLNFHLHIPIYMFLFVFSLLDICMQSICFFSLMQKFFLVYLVLPNSNLARTRSSPQHCRARRGQVGNCARTV